MKLRLDHIQLAIPEGGENAARAFWTGLLDCEELEKPAPLSARGGVWFCVGNAGLHLGIETPFTAAKKAHPAFLVPDIDRLAARLKSVKWDRSLPGRRRFFTTDPFGNRIEFIQDSRASSV